MSDTGWRFQTNAEHRHRHCDSSERVIARGKGGLHQKFDVEGAMADPKHQMRSDYRYQLAIPVRWMDCDAYGHVNNVIYYAMMDQVVTVYIVEKGVIDTQASSSIGLCVASGCDFHQSLEFPEIVDARLRIGRIGAKSVRYEIGLFRDGIEAPAATGHFVHVYVDRESRRPVSLTAEQRSALEPLLILAADEGE
jgi:acyl-CoA thioester hydrolase